MADITQFATPTTATEAVSLPAGSEFLTSERMIRAISEAGYQPLCFRRPAIDRAILPYVESGIPVILGLNIDGTLGHAVTVIGRVFAKQDPPTNSRHRLRPRLHSPRRPERPLHVAPHGLRRQHDLLLHQRYD